MVLVDAQPQAEGLTIKILPPGSFDGSDDLTSRDVDQTAERGKTDAQKKAKPSSGWWG